MATSVNTVVFNNSLQSHVEACEGVHVLQHVSVAQPGFVSSHEVRCARRQYVNAFWRDCLGEGETVKTET